MAVRTLSRRQRQLMASGLRSTRTAGNGCRRCSLPYPLPGSFGASTVEARSLHRRDSGSPEWGEDYDGMSEGLAR